MKSLSSLFYLYLIYPLYKYDFVDMVVSKNLPEKVFKNYEELVIWFRENQKRLLEVWKKLNYGK